MFKEGELHMQQYPVRTIDLEALRENVRLLRSTLPEKTKLMAVVKADAYGHGIAKVARAALEAGASALAVARTDEGAALRQAGVTAPVLVLGASSDEEIAEGVRNELTLTVCTPEMFSQGEWQLLSIARAAAADPAVLLLDEITANLDAETEARVLEALRRASTGRTVLSISHRIYENLGGRTVEIRPAL